MTGVIELGYFGISVSDGAAWREYVTKYIGMEIAEGDNDNQFHLRMDNWFRRITVDVNGEDDLSYIGWRVASGEDLAAMADKLKSAKIKFKWGSDAEASERRVLGLLKLESPGGIPTEIFHGPQIDANKPFHPGRPLFGKFLTGDQGLGHFVLNEMHVPEALAFYSLLGFCGGEEYALTMPDGMVVKPIFMSCNERQHSIAFNLGPMEKRINHLMLEYTELDDLGLAHDIIRKANIDVALQLGKHSNDQMLSFYCANPSGWLWELGWGARKRLPATQYYTGDIFGHGPEASGYGMDGIDL